MQKKYRFRKIHFICSDKKVIEECYDVTSAFRTREYANKLLQANPPRKTHYLWEDKNVPHPIKTVEGFYLVHESLYEKLLKEHDINAK